MRKIGWLLIVVLVIAAAGVAGWRSTHTETAMEGLQSALDQSTPSWAMKRMIAEEPIAEGDRLFFYESPEGVVIVARMKQDKTFWSTDWKLLGAIGAGGAGKQPGSGSQFALSAKGYGDYQITNGTLYNDQIETVTVGDQPAKIVGKLGDTRVFYDVRPFPENHDGTSAVKVYDKQGKLLDEMPL